MSTPARLPDAASLETDMAGLDPASAVTDMVPALNAAFPGFAFDLAPIDDDYWRDTRSILQPDGTRLGELRPWMTAEIAKDGGDIKAVWSRLKETDLQITEWRGSSAFVSAPTGPGAADYRLRLDGRSNGGPDRSSTRTTVRGANRSCSIRAGLAPISFRTRIALPARFTACSTAPAAR